MIAVKRIENAQQELLHHSGWFGRGVVLLAVLAIAVFGFTVGAIVDVAPAVVLIAIFTGVIWATMIKIAESGDCRRS